MEYGLFYTFVTLLVIINPVEAAATFDTLTSGYDAGGKARIALRSTIVAFAILIVFGFVGDALLTALGIGFPAFRIGGGLLLLKVGFNMVFAQPDAGKSASAPRADPSVFPLAIPIICGPGALTVIVTLMTRTHGSPMQVVDLVVIAVIVMALTYVTMRASLALTRWLGATGVDAIGRVMGIIVTAIAIQIIVEGVATLMPTIVKLGN